jgi:hypothetical protein
MQAAGQQEGHLLASGGSTPSTTVILDLPNCPKEHGLLVESLIASNA